jgi:hypothetical protein
MNGTWLFLWLSIFPLFLFGQVYIGVNGGGGLNDLVSLRVAVPVEVQLSKSWRLQPALVYTQQHTPALLFRLSKLGDYRRATIEYIGLPILCSGRFSLPPFAVYATAGPELNYALTLKATLENSSFRQERLDFNSLQVSRWSVSVIAGIGLEKVIHNDCKIRFEFLYLLGLSDIDINSESSIYTEGKIFNLGLLIPL